MATVQEPRPRAKYDSLLHAHLEHARGRVRNADLLVGLLGLLSLVLAFGVAMMLADRWFVLPDWTRQVALVGFLAIMGWYAWRVLARPLGQAVNPYYAARQVEQTIPEAKNSIVTWLDLREEPLAATVREAVSRKAAEDLGYANVDQAVSDRRLSLFGVAAATLAAIALALLLYFRPAPFFSLLSRAFLPFSGTAIARQTELTIAEPAGGDATVPIHQSVMFRVDVSGRVPKSDDADAVRLRLRYNPDDAVWEEKRLEATDRARQFSLRLPSAQVRTGFEYQIVGGDAQTPIHQVRVRARPLVTDFEVRYHYRPYLRFADDVRTDPNLQAVRGTEVTIFAKTNRAVAGGELRLAPVRGEPLAEVTAERVADRPDTLKYTLILERDAQYRLKFKAGDGEESDETLPYDIRVLPDNPPTVDWIKAAPGRMPLNGTLALAAKATDDFGLTKARLRLRYKSSAEAQAEDLPNVEHQGGKPLIQGDGTQPRAIGASEVIALDTLVDVTGVKLRLRPGAVIEYFFEAEDNFDFPKPQVGRSDVKSVTLGEPQDEQKRDAEREKAQRDQKEQEAQQNQQPGQGNDKPQEGDKKPEGTEGQPNDGQGTGGQPKEKDTMDKADKLAEAIKNQQNGKQPNQPSNNQPQDGDKSEQGSDSSDKANVKPQPNNPSQSGNQSGSDPKSSKSGENGRPDSAEKTDAGKPQVDGESKSGDKSGPANNKQGEGHQDGGKDSNKVDRSTPQPHGDNRDAGQSVDKADQPQAKPDQKSRTGDKADTAKGQPDSKTGNKSQGRDKADTENEEPNAAPKSGDNQSERDAPKAERPPQVQPASPPNPSATRPDGKSAQPNPDAAKPNPGNPAAKGAQAPENKAGEKTNKSGEKSGSGPMDKPSDQAPKTSPEKGNAEGGRQGSQRADTEPKVKDKADKPDGQAKSGKSDPNAPKPDGKQGDNAASNPGQPQGEQPSAKPDGGQPGKPNASSPKSSDVHDAAKPHGKPGDSPSAKPKTDGTPSKPAAGNEKPNGDASQTKLPADIQKMVDDFQKADDATKKQILQKLEDLAKSAPTQQKRQAAGQGAKICNGDCDNPNGTGGQPKPDGKSDGQGDKPNPGQGANPKAGKTGGDKPGNEQANDNARQGEPKAGNKPGDKADPIAGKQPKADGDKGDAGAPNADHPPDGEPKEADGPASDQGMARGKRNGAGDIRPGTVGPPKAPDEEFLRKSGDLQLEDFRKRVDKSVLDQVKMTEAEYQEFLKAYESLVKRAKAAKPEPADRVRGATKGGSSANAAARKINPGEKSGPKTERGGRGAAPPEFREQYKETTEQQSKQKPAGS